MELNVIYLVLVGMHIGILLEKKNIYNSNCENRLNQTLYHNLQFINVLISHGSDEL